MTALRAAAAWLALMLAVPTAAEAPEDGIRATIGRWYEELGKREKGRLWDVAAPGFIDASPPYRHIDNGSRALGPRVYTSLAAQALKFAWEIERVRRDSSFARVRVWERGYFYAWAAGKTYERAAAATFILERGEKDGLWRIAAHQSGSSGIPPNKVTDPMPDLRALFYATEGKDRDPARDALADPR